ncbi:MAG: 50S ribosomal protein L29 [Candidatus Acidiferrales bacterium]
MELEKIRNLSDDELAVEQNKSAEQLFRLRFQLRLGQSDVVKKVRGLRKDIARIKTVVRERELGLHGAEHKTESSAPANKRKAPKKAARKAPKTVAKKTAAKKAVKHTAAKKTKKKTATKKEAR